MGLTKFKLFSSTGPSVAIGLAITLVASLTLTPALLVLLAKVRPRSFQGLVRPSQGFWDEVGSRVLAKPALAWVATVAFMAIPATIGLGTHFVQDLFSELPSETRSVKDFRLIAEKFGAGTVAPLTVVIRSDIDLRGSTGLALIDDVTRLISHQRSTAEVRSATRPLGNPATLEPARLASRLGAVSVGFGRLIEGADQMRMGLNQGAARLRTAMQIERATGMTLTGSPTEAAASARKSMMSGLTQATSSLMGRRRAPADATKSANPGSAASTEKTAGQPKEDPRETLLRELTMAADGASQISQGASRAQQELADILVDPVGRLALERLLINPRTIREHPELLESFAAYISPDGNVTRVDVTLIERIFSTDAMKQVETLRRRLKDHLGEQDLVNAEVSVTGANAQSADIWSMTTRDQQLTWIIVPIGVIVILWFALRDIRACVNLVATMLLTYAFALGVAHLVFVSWLGAPALDWKVPYFLFVLLVAVGVDYNIFLMTRLQEESRLVGLRGGIQRAIAQTGGLITSAAAITASSFAAFLSSPLASLRQLGLALVVGIVIDAVLVRPILVPCGHWLMNRRQERRKLERGVLSPGVRPRLETVAD
jgi:RND superfamily putative drug exporter